MQGMTPLEPGQRVELKKPHACGANEWEIVRLGMDIKLRCVNCGRYVTLPRQQCERRVKKVLSQPDQQ